MELRTADAYDSADPNPLAAFEESLCGREKKEERRGDDWATEGQGKEDHTLLLAQSTEKLNSVLIPARSIQQRRLYVCS